MSDYVSPELLETEPDSLGTDSILDKPRGLQVDADPFGTQAPRTPDQALAEKYSVSENIASKAQMDKIQKNMDEVIDSVSSDESFLEGIVAGYGSGKITSQLNSLIDRAHKEGDEESADPAGTSTSTP